MSKELKVRNPRCGAFDYQITPPDESALIDIAKQLKKAQPAWAERPLEARIAVLEDFIKSIAAQRETLLEALVTDTGRYGISVAEVDGMAAQLARWAQVARNFSTSAPPHQTTHASIDYISQYVPFGLVGVISPWNFPLTLSFIDSLPALLGGNAVLIKPSEITPRFAAPLRAMLESVEGLRDVLAIIDGDGQTGAQLIKQVDAICFTGSVKTGKQVAQNAAAQFIPAFLELGGNDPAIVLADADLDHASTALLRASILNTGQACQSIERIYVAQPLYEDFCQQLCDKAGQVKLNKASLYEGHIGPFIDGRQGDIVAAQLEDAREKGAKILMGGEIEREGGVWCLPTIVTNATHDMALLQDETFGPILPIIPFADETEAARLANDTRYGLSAAVFSTDLDHAETIARQIQAGAVSINDASLTGFVHEAEKNSFKSSGLGASRMGESGYTRFFRKKALIRNMDAPAPITQFDEAKNKSANA